MQATDFSSQVPISGRSPSEGSNRASLFFLALRVGVGGLKPNGSNVLAPTAVVFKASLEDPAGQARVESCVRPGVIKVPS